MQRIYFTIIVIMVSFQLFSQGNLWEKRNLLTTAYPKSLLNDLLVKEHAWVSYPAYKDRSAWESIHPVLRMKYIEAGEKYLNYGWPAIRATEYLEFSRTGNQQVVDKPLLERIRVLRVLVIAELMEGKGRFMDDIVNGVFSFCEQTTWALTAHFNMYRTSGTILPDVEDPIIDLRVADIAADLCWVWYFFHEEFDKISPVISSRLKSELTNKVLIPFYEQNDIGWMGLKGQKLNNWTPWCNHNMLTCIMLLENDPLKRIEAVFKTMTSVDLFFNTYPNDGGCDEGPTYWGNAGGKAFEYLNLLYAVSNGKITIFDHPLIKEIGRYIYRVHIAGGMYFVNFADGAAKFSPRAGIIYRYGKKINDNTMSAFGAFLLSQANFNETPEIASLGVLGTVFENMFNLGDWKQTATEETLISEYYFPDIQVLVARDKAGTSDGFYIAAKGGHNAESHNHNDVGSCVLFFDGHPVLVDAGVGTYTKETFSEKRYGIWTMQSNYHNLPLINGVAQNAGSQYTAKNSKYKSNKTQVSFSTDIAGAYPENANVDSWVRSYTLERGKRVVISDQFKLKVQTDSTLLHLMTPLQCSVLSHGVIEMKSDHFVIHLKYNPNKLSAHIETKEMDDPPLRSVWGDQLNRLVFVVNGKKSDKISIEILNYKQ